MQRNVILFAQIKIMKRLLKITLVIALIASFAACQSQADLKQLLSKSETRREIMDNIANDSTMAKEMMEVLMNASIGKTMIQENEKVKMTIMDNQDMMMKMLKNNPGMMQMMMSNMIDAAKNDSTMMSGICRTMMGNQAMMDMMEKMKGGGNKDLRKMEGMNNKSHH